MELLLKHGASIQAVTEVSVRLHQVSAALLFNYREIIYFTAAVTSHATQTFILQSHFYLYLILNVFIFSAASLSEAPTSRSLFDLGSCTKRLVSFAVDQRINSSVVGITDEEWGSTEF